MHSLIYSLLLYSFLFLFFYYFPGAFQFHSELQSVRLYQSTGNLHLFVVAAEVIYLLFIIYYMYKQVNSQTKTPFNFFALVQSSNSIFYFK